MSFRYDGPLTVELQDVLHKQLIGQQVIRSCLNCDYFIMNTCEKFGEVPPPRIIVYACPEWVPNIPF